VSGSSASGESLQRQEFRERAEALGLSTVHICSQQEAGTLRVSVGGAHVALRGDPELGACFGGDRGVVRGFSKASRRRLLRFLHTIDRERAGLPLFVTLTYPGTWPGKPAKWKRDLRSWLGRLRRALPEAWCVWRLEPQRRGAPHYHLLVFGIASLSIEWLSRTWFEVVGSGDLRHLRAGTQVQYVRSWHRVVGYAAKYLAKEPKELPVEWRRGVGRWWGIHQRPRAPREVLEARITQDQFFRVRRVLRRFVGGPGASGRDWFADGHKSVGVLVRRGLQVGLSDDGALQLLGWAKSHPQKCGQLPETGRVSHYRK